jgi:5-methylcytosine-specific restriction protein A
MATMNLVAWTPEGTREEIYAKDVLAFEGFENVRAHLWPRMQATIVNRDKHTCQDCGAKEGTQDQHGNSLSFEVHHIIPRGLGGSDHPRNLKFLCKPCHKKYNDKFNGYIKKVKRAKAQDLEKFCENDGGVL